MFKRIAAIAAFLMMSGVANAASVHYATAIDWSNNGTVGSSNGRNVAANALGAPDGRFLSLGLTARNGSNPGFAVFDFGQVFTGPGFVFETTFRCSVSGATCAGHREQVEVWLGTDYAFGSNDLSDVLDDFTRLPDLIGNAEAQGGASFQFDGSFRYLALVDRSGVLRNGSVDGFDVDAIGVTPVPVPAALPLMAAALAGLGLVARRRRA
jgi:hypothetical protein